MVEIIVQSLLTMQCLKVVEDQGQSFAVITTRNYLLHDVSKSSIEADDCCISRRSFMHT
jgi:hypothetical protein